MNSNDQSIADWIREIIRERGWSGTELARKAGLSPSTVLRALNDPQHPFSFSGKTLRRIEAATGSNVPRALLESLTDKHPLSETAGGKPAVTHFKVDVPVIHVSAMPASMRTSNVTTKLHVARPPQLADDQTAFAFRNPDQSLSGWFKPRCLMFATKERDPVAGDIIMVTDRQERTRVRLLLSVDESGLHLSRSMPAESDETFPFEDIHDIGVVVLVETS